VVGHSKQAVLKIYELVRNVNRDDLAAAVAEQLLAERETSQQKRTLSRPLAFADHVRVLSEARAGERKAQKRASVVGRQIGVF
jgi:hypothetical protein